MTLGCDKHQPKVDTEHAYHSATSSTHSRGRVLFRRRYPCKLATCEAHVNTICTYKAKLPTLNSSSGIASAKRLASSVISASSSKGMALYLRFGKGRFCCDVSLEDAVELASLAALNGKKHLKIPSAWNFVACVKFTQTSIRPGRLRAGSKRSI